jgi:Synergist-CTERM protein sorting domain-containing protein
MNKGHEGKFWVKKLSAALSVVLLLCGAAAADIVYTTSDYTTGELGTISIGENSTVSPSLVPGLGGDTAVFSFSDGSGKPRVAIAEHLAASDTVTIYDPNDGWGTRIAQESWSVNGVPVYNIHGMAASGNMLYAACNGSRMSANSGSNIVQVSMTDYRPTGKAYNYEDSSGYTAYAEKVLVLGNDVYALFSRAKGGYTEYGKSKLVKLTKDLVKVDEYDVGENALDMVAVNDGNGIVVAYMGGPQAYGTVGGLDQVFTKTGNVVSLSDNKDLIKAQMIMALCYINERCLYFIGQNYETADLMIPPVSKLYRWAGSMDAAAPITEVADISSATGYSYQVAFDNKSGEKVVTLAGDKILVFNLDNNTPEKEFPGTELGGSAYSFALTDRASGGSSDDESSSGCSAGLTAAFLVLAVLPLALRKTYKTYKTYETRGKNR